MKANWYDNYIGKKVRIDAKEWIVELTEGYGDIDGMVGTIVSLECEVDAASETGYWNIKLDSTDEYSTDKLITGISDYHLQW